MTRSYHINVDPAVLPLLYIHPPTGDATVPDSEQTAQEPWETQAVIDQRLDINGGSVWLDYIDLGLKALTVIAAFLIAAKL